MHAENSSSPPIRWALLATGDASYVQFGRIAAVLGSYDVLAVSYRRDEDTGAVSIHIEVLVPDVAAGNRLERRLLRCVGIREVVSRNLGFPQGTPTSPTPAGSSRSFS